jgi:glycosyltransferase involved in cell wall biosynthesis
MNIPLVSICIPTYNGEEFLQESLNSILIQTYRNIEIVFSDDESTDATIEILNDFKTKSPFPVILQNHVRSGIGANWNNALKYANGKYIKFLFQDDILEPECIEKMVDLAESDPSIGLVYCPRKILISGDVKNSDSWLKYCEFLHNTWSFTFQEGTLNGKALLLDNNFLKSPENKIGEPSVVLLTREAIDRVGQFNIELKQTLDYEYWYRLMKYYNISFINEEMVTFRLHPKQATQTNQQESSRGYVEKYKLYSSFIKELFWYLNNKNRLAIIKFFIIGYWKHYFKNKLVNFVSRTNSD